MKSANEENIIIVKAAMRRGQSPWMRQQDSSCLFLFEPKLCSHEHNSPAESSSPFGNTS